MSDADAGANDDPNMTTITLKIPEAFLDDLDATWRAEDFPSRSEFIRWALRDAVKHPTFSRKGWKDIAASEHQLATAEGRTYSSDEIRARLNKDMDAGE
ncbi:CopG domain protein (plasmid) [Natronomonas pharaonis DSM 2160]|uniref:CopG domain protein n=1 Tax=Natronomonas pharaonis (strain ATCC 35678 / DSM 2160 / CIP 103997 / JCM 8858 / NBRC 14720 / NCIMB 2260 / Gabara) TaxID=348780 RepID=Q3IM20_NATPD|nr:ribbon-helix-helix domain-containing protein [Natronomonas pharaonis]CAI50846.2 CopG domain protein [Natronomonas pharaonis DSM 2160]